jgi:hypothetical protein
VSIAGELEVKVRGLEWQQFERMVYDLIEAEHPLQMLEHALATISRLHDGQAPIVWAAIDNSNTTSQKLFGEFGFEPVPGLLSRGLVAWARDAAA